MPELLTGTVTFLFSDIEGSTRLLQSQGAGWPALLARHQELLRTAFTAHGGAEVGTEGDSFFVAFPTAPGAVAAAVDAQRALAGEPWPPGVELLVRMGMHTGEASLSTDSYVGLNVHRASRIASVARGGQVLLSDSTRGLVANALPDGVELRDLGDHRLKDLDRAEHLFQLVIPGLPSDFPAIGSLGSTPNNLPARLTTFLGREREIGAVVDLAGSHRLVTLTGPGGTGKTRLSLEVARRLVEQHPDGVYFVELAPITQPELVAAEIGRAIALPERGGRTAMERLVEFIGERRMLLVLDNFEQVMGGATSVSELLASCPSLTILTSSRSGLRISGEQEYPVPPLALPNLARLPGHEELSQYDAVALFIERARAVRPDFMVTNDNAPAVAEICVRLDGLPLAIELAAARIRILSPQAMLGRIEQRLALLAGGARDLPARQQTLRGAIAWSHDMLDEADRALFAGLSVFVGSASLDAIERVCGDLLGSNVIDALASLVDKSLLRQREGPEHEPRFEMLETIREFALEQATERNELDALRQRHADHYLEVATLAGSQVMGSAKRSWLDRLEADHENLRAALGWAVETDRAEAALRMTAALWRFWQMRGHLGEGRDAVTAALALPHAAEHPAARADALSALAGLAYWQGDSAAARAAYEEEIALRRELGDRAGEAEALYGASFTWSIGELAEDRNAEAAAALIEQAIPIFRELGDELAVGRCEWALAIVRYGQGELQEARESGLRALAIFQAADDRFMTGWTTYTLGLADLSEDYQAADGVPDARVAAAARLTGALRIFDEAEDSSGYTLVLDALALLALRNGDRDRAARLAGAVARLERETGTGLAFWNRGTLGYDPTVLLTDPEAADAWTAGEALTTAEAVAYALEGASAGE